MGHLRYAATADEGKTEGARAIFLLLGLGTLCVSPRHGLSA